MTGNNGYEESKIVKQALQQAHSLLKTFAVSDNFLDKLKLSFGDSFDLSVAERLTQDWAVGEFGALPKLEIRFVSEINGANGAFSSTTNTIYVSREFLSNNATNLQGVTNVLLEEIGHFIDSRINRIDTIGDEGAIFSSLVRGYKPTSNTFQEIRSEDDSATVELNSQQVTIEQSTDFTSVGELQNWVNDLKGSLPFLSYNFQVIDENRVKFDNVSINVKEFFDSFLTSVLSDVDRFIQPIRPVINALTKNIDFLTNPIPDGLDARDTLDFEKEITPNEITILDFVKHYADISQKFDFNEITPFIKAVKEILNVLDFVSTVQQTGTVSLGSFNYDFANDLIDSNSLGSNVYSQLNAIVPGFNDRLKSLSGLSLPILENISNVFGLLVGKQEDLFTYKMPSIGLSASSIDLFQIPIYAILFAKGRLENISLDSSLTFGFDTEGLKQTSNGFYISDNLVTNPDGTKSDLPEFNFSGEIGVGLSLNAAEVIQAFGRGIIHGGVTLDLRDPNNDGKIRNNEFSNKLFDQINVQPITGSIRSSIETPVGYFLRNIYNKANLVGNRVADRLTDLAKHEGGWIGEAGEFLGQTSKRVVPTVEKFINWLSESYEKVTGEHVETFFDQSKPANVLLQIDSPEVKLWNGQSSGDGSSSITIRNGLSFTGTPDNDVKYGNSGKDYLLGLGGNDELHGGAGDDRLDGGTDNDLLYGEDDNDKLYGNEGFDNLYGGNGTDLLVGAGDEDFLNGGSGNDRIVGGNGRDTASYYDSPKAVIVDLRTGTASGGDGNDNLVSIESVTGSNFGDILNGDDGINNLLGRRGDNFINGNGGNDTVYGGADNDILAGGLGDDLIVGVGGTDIALYGSDTTTGIVASLTTGEVSGGAGNDTLMDIEWVFGSYQDDVLSGDSNANTLWGIGGNDTLYGGGGNDNLDGRSGDDWIDGGPGDDVIDGGFITDQTTGDHYFTDFNTVSYEDAPGSVSVNVGKVVIIGQTKRTEGTASGSAGNDQLFAIDAVRGSVYGDILIGSSLNDYLYGNDGDDLLSGKAGDDVLDGGGDRDLVTYSDASTPVEVYLNTGIASSGDDNDVLVSIEDVFGSAFDDILVGNDTFNKLSGGDGNDYLSGSKGGDFLLGGIGNDYLDGGEAVDSMFGELGDDVYVIDNVDDFIAEQPDEGKDQVIATVTYSLSQANNLGVEALVLIGSNSINGTGNSLENNIEGNNAANALYGEAGNDALNGAGGDDFLDGAGGDDFLDGAVGSDTLIGGDGNDSYKVDSIGDVVIEDNSTGSFDSIQASVNYTLSTNVENLFLVTGNIAINGIGNDLNNVITGNEGSNILEGGAGLDTLEGLEGNDTYIVDSTTDNIREVIGEGTADTVKASVDYKLGTNDLENLTLTGSAISGTGNTLSNTITGNSASNSLNGDAGNDTLIGGGGIDTLTGGTGDDSLTGGAGTDSLIGNAGKDHFVFTSKTEGKDTITDFLVVDDTINVSATGFGGKLKAGAAITTSQFNTGTRAFDTSDRFIYNKATGALLFDADGTGVIASIQFAQLSTGLALTNNDIFVLA